MDSPLPSTSGIKTVGPAILFVVLYAVLAFLYTCQTARNPAYAFIVLVLFCIFRVVGFILRAILAASDGAKENGGLVIAEAIFLTLGFVDILYSVFLLILERADVARKLLGEDEGEYRSSNRILDFVLSRRITDLTFTAALGVSIAAAAYIISDSEQSERLRKVAIILYLEITANLSVQAAILAYKEKNVLSKSLNSGVRPQPPRLNVFRILPGLGLRHQPAVGQRYATYVLCVILLLLLIRQAYLLATFSSDRQDNESLWYPFIAAPEFLAACLFSIPGLVPRTEELSEEDKKRSDWSKLWKAYNTTA